MKSGVLLILVIAFCLAVLALLIRLLAANRSKDRINYTFDEPPTESEVKDLDERVCELLDLDRKIEAINLAREEKNMGWKDAEDYVESFETGIEFLPTEEERGLTTEELEDKVYELLLQNKKVKL